MLTRFKMWYTRNQTRINWFLTGWLSLSGIQSLVRGNYFDAALCAAFVALNLAFDQK